LLGLLANAAEGTIETQVNPKLAQSIYPEISAALARQVENEEKPDITLAPLVVNEHTVLSTQRLMDVLSKAYKRGRESSREEPAIIDLLFALFDEANNSEVDFVRNRLDGIDGVLKRFADENAGSDPSPALRQILSCAVEHAKRVGSRRLDINHLSMALLDENHPCINAVVPAFNEGQRARTALKRRLEQCLLWQTYHRAFQSEEGQPLDLDRLAELFDK
jgi:ATP-dependent Clp protease ATP-binding subunit ClpA